MKTEQSKVCELSPTGEMPAYTTSEQAHVRVSGRYAGTKIIVSWSFIIAVLFTSVAEAQQTINGCLIKRRASCPGVNLSGMDLTKSNLPSPNLQG